MLKRFWISNFRNLVNVEFRPAGMNMLIGPNNAGKTNLCAALRFLALTAGKPLDVAAKEAVGETWNLANVYVAEPVLRFELDCQLNDQGTVCEFTYHLELRATIQPGPSTPALTVVSETLSMTGGKNPHDSWSLSNKGDRAKITAGTTTLRDLKGLASTQTALCATSGVRGHGPLDLFRDYLRTWSYFNLIPSAMRSTKVIRDEAGLLSDGSNLSRTFFSLHNENPRIMTRIVEAVKAFDPKLDVFTYQSPDPESVFLFLEDEK
ncbi:MAG: AAA family ATPase, partial [Phycisphaerae bacterium]|nr:AAA family ATPase [Phycisphaerae bacterium]